MSHLDQFVSHLDSLCDQQRLMALMYFRHDVAAPFRLILQFSELLEEEMKSEDHPSANELESLIKLKNKAREVGNALYNKDLSVTQFVQSYIIPHYSTLTSFPINSNSDMAEEIILAQEQLTQYIYTCFGVGEMKSFDFYKHVKLFSQIYESNLKSKGIEFLESVFHANIITKEPYLELDNLIGNAIKHADCSRIVVGIDDTADDEYVVHVLDNGKGVDVQSISAILRGDTQYQNNPKTSLTTHSNTPPIFGTGENLGLHIVREGIERKEGRLWVESPITTEMYNGSNQIIRDGTGFYFSVPDSMVLSSKKRTDTL